MSSSDLLEDLGFQPTDVWGPEKNWTHNPEPFVQRVDQKINNGKTAENWEENQPTSKVSGRFDDPEIVWKFHKLSDAQFSHSTWRQLQQNKNVLELDEDKTNGFRRTGRLGEFLKIEETGLSWQKTHGGSVVNLNHSYVD